MSSLPPLRTVNRPPSSDNDTPPASDSARTPGVGTANPVITPPPATSLQANKSVNPPTHALGPSRDLGEISNKLPPATRDFLTGLIAAHLLDHSQIRDFLRKEASRISGLTDPVRTAEALVTHKFLTNYQADRILSQHTHGLVIGPYRVLDRWGGGSVGAVLLAEHRLMNRRVALKMLSEDESVSELLVNRFQEEIKIMSRLNHPHIVAIHDAGVIPASETGKDQLHYFVMELVPGGDVEEHIYKQGVQSPQIVVEWGRQVASALIACHSLGILHRDIKPSNMLLTEDQQIKLVDFGLGQESSAIRTQHGVLLGTLEFMPPEQLADAASVGPPADIYALAASMFWILTGKLHFPKMSNMAEALESIRTGIPRRIRDLNPELPADLEKIIDRMLTRVPSDRPDSAEVYEELSRLAIQYLQASASDVEAAAVPATPVTVLKEIRDLQSLNRQQKKQLEKARKALLVGLGAIAAHRPGESAEHVTRVQEGVRLLGDALKRFPEWIMFQDPQSREDIILASGAHDLGLVGIPDDLIRRHPPHSKAEQAEFESHTKKGADILFAIANEGGTVLPFLRIARAVIQHHHERWDGTGYPHRLAGLAIPPAARAAAVSIAYEEARQSGKTHQEAVNELVIESGRAFDPKVIEAFQSKAQDFETLYSSLSEQTTREVPEPPVPTPPVVMPETVRRSSQLWLGEANQTPNSRLKWGNRPRGGSQ